MRPVVVADDVGVGIGDGVIGDFVIGDGEICDLVICDRGSE